MPAVSELRTPPATQGQVIALRAQGTPKRKIARELGIDKNTVDSILKAYGTDKAQSVTRITQITPHAYDAVEKAVRAGDARIGMEWLKHTELVERKSEYHISGDVVQTLNLLPQVRPTDQPSTTMGTESTSPLSSIGTEAAAKPPSTDVSLSKYENFLVNLSTADLLAELARRSSSGDAEAAAVPQAHSLPAQAERRVAEVCASGEIIDAEVVGG